MPSKLLKQFLQESAELDSINDSLVEEKSRSKHMKKRKRNPEPLAVEDSSNEEGNELQNQVEAMLFYDVAFSRRDQSRKDALQRKGQEHKQIDRERKRISKDAFSGSLSNSRSTSSKFKQLKPTPTFNKRKDAEKKKIKSLRDLAKRLQVGGKKKQKKK
jgi:hypothetical protein